jgi:chemotaxis protein methyltransferase CheR
MIATMVGLNRQLSDLTFQYYSQWMKAETGVYLSPIKKTLVLQRLSRRLDIRKINSFEAYLRLIKSEGEETERQLALDLLTTHETFFFREPTHFDWFKKHLMQNHAGGKAIRVWSAAASTGEEVWSLAMTLADCMGPQGSWSLLGSDISLPALDKAKRGHYGMQRCEGIPKTYLKQFCLKGQGTQHNTLLIDAALRQKVDFKALNLNQELPEMPLCDVIFLRNVLIYFDQTTKKEVVSRCLQKLQPEGYLLVSHSESLNGLGLNLSLIQAGVYQKPKTAL